MTAKTFGRRAPASSPRRAPAPVSVAAPVPQADAAPVAIQAVATIDTSVAAVAAAELPADEELRRWKEERRQTLFLRLPWKQLSLFASISFGVASFVLPDSVNDSVDYLLWGLAAASFIVWINGFKKKTQA